MSIYRDKKSGRYMFEFDSRIDGQRVRARKILPKTWNKAQAEAFGDKERARIFAQVKNGERIHHTIDDAVAKYVDYRCPELKSGTETIKELALIHWAYSGKPIEKLDEVCWEITKDGREDKRGPDDKKGRGVLSSATIRNRIRYLTAACRYAWRKHGIGQTDPGERVSVPRVSNERQVYGSRKIMLQIARSCRNRTVRSILRIAFYSGMRRSEIMRAVPHGDVFILTTSKNGDPRHVPIHPKVRSCLSIYPVTISKSTVVKHWMLARNAHGMNHLHFHDLRHSAASEMINNGVDLYTVGSVLGHKDPRSTQRYAHLATDTLAAAINRIGKKRAA